MTSVEVSSDQLRKELQEIKERIGTLESIQAHLNKEKIIDIIREGMADSAQRKEILKFCEQARTREELQKELKLNTGQALDNHIRPLRDYGLIERTELDGKVAYIRSRLFSKLPNAALKKLFS